MMNKVCQGGESGCFLTTNTLTEILLSSLLWPCSYPPPCVLVEKKTPIGLPTKEPFIHRPPVASQIVFTWAGIPPKRVGYPNRRPSHLVNASSTEMVFSPPPPIAIVGILGSFSGACIFARTSFGKVSGIWIRTACAPAASTPFFTDLATTEKTVS